MNIEVEKILKRLRCRLATEDKDFHYDALFEAEEQISKLFPRPLTDKERWDEAVEIVLEIRQHLCNTEFAPEPFTAPLDLHKLKVEFPQRILNLIPSQPLTNQDYFATKGLLKSNYREKSLPILKTEKPAQPLTDEALREKIACLHCGRRTRTNCGLVIKDLSSHWCKEAKH